MLHLVHATTAPTSQSRDPEPDLLEDVSGDLHGPVQVSRIQSRFAGVEVHIDGVDEPGALDQFPGEEEDEEDRDADIGGDEVVDAEGVAEGVEAVEDDDHGEEDQGGPGGVGLEGGFEHESVSVDSLGFKGFVELDVGDAD